MVDDISSDEWEEIVELVSDEDDLLLKINVIENEGRDERVSYIVRSIFVSIGSEKSGVDV